MTYKGFATVIYKDNEYSHIHLKINQKTTKDFGSGDFIKDWYNLQKFCKDFFILSYSSSIDHHIFDNQDKIQMKCLIIQENGTPELVDYDQIDDFDDFITFYIPRNSNFTWLDLKNYCTLSK